MSKIRFHATKLFDGYKFSTDQVLTVQHGKVVAMDNDIANADIFLDGIVAPGYIDLQVNGGGGVLFNDSPSVEKLKVMFSAHAKFGTTAMMPTLITDKLAVMQQAADTIAEAIKNELPGMLGIHFEGPHLSISKKGTHCEDYIRPISDAEWQIYSRQDLGKIMVTIAPESVSPSDVKRLVDLGITVCVGHTNADFDTVQRCIDAGASGFTHLFNAMSPLQGREPGAVGAALLNDDVSCGLIVDGHHVDIVNCQLAIKSKPRGKLFLVTDAMPPVGTNQTQFPLYDRTVFVNAGKLTSTTGELAGSTLNMALAVKNTHEEAGLDLEEAIRMASLYPAQFLSPNKMLIRGELSIGKQADMIVLNDDLSVSETWIAGIKV